MKAHIIILLPVCDLSTIDGKLMTNDWKVRPLRDCQCYTDTEEENRDVRKTSKRLRHVT